MTDQNSGLRAQIAAHLEQEYNLAGEKLQFMVEMGCKDIRKRLDELAALTAPGAPENNCRALEKTAHAVKGVLLNLGLEPLAEEAREIEQAAGEGRVAGDRLARLLRQAAEL